MRFDDPTHFSEDGYQLFLVPLMVLRDGLPLLLGVVGRILVPGNLLAPGCPAETVPAAVAVADFHARPKIEGPPRVKIEPVDVVVADHVFHEIEVGPPIGRVPADGAVVFADEHVVATGPAAGPGPLRILRVVARDHGPGELVPGGDVGDYANATLLGGGDRFCQQIPFAQVGVRGKADSLDRGVLAHRGNPHRIGVHLGHGPGKGLGVVLECGSKRRLVGIHEEYACRSDPGEIGRPGRPKGSGEQTGDSEESWE